MGKKRQLLLILLLSGLYSSAQATSILPSPNEPNLMGSGGILDSHFGLGNLQHIDDDQMWVGLANVKVAVVAHHSAYTHSFGYVDASDNYVSLLSNISGGSGQSASFNAGNSGAPFRFGLDSHHEPLFSSAMNGNPDGGKDHMVSWRITDGKHAGDVIIAWEDLLNLGDSDYNDVVLRVSGVNQYQHRHQHGVSAVPVPPAVWLFISGLVGVVGIARRNRRRT
ncbi:MAG: DUF4114 domain-containing protein [Gammaproteobacteria bacterium]|nr:DUF4114 domain-containing protein [Gammaproteobacteria bacterium]